MGRPRGDKPGSFEVVRDLADKLVVITGAGSGIGRALAGAFAARGCHLALIDVRAEGLAATAEPLRAAGTTLSTHVADVGAVEELEAARDAIVETHGGVDLLVNNAGVTVFGSFEDHSPADIERVLAINLGGVIHGCRLFLPVLRERGRGHIVNLSSEAGLAGMPWQTLYCTSKFAVRGFSAALRSELRAGPGDIGLTCVLPGATRTNILASAAEASEGQSETLARLVEGMGRAFSPDRVARKVVRAVRWNKAELFVGPDSWMLDWAQRSAPGLVRLTMALVAREAVRREGTNKALGPGEEP